MWTANIGLTPQMYVGFFFFFQPYLPGSLCSFSGLHTPEEEEEIHLISRWLGSSNGAKIYYAIIVVAF